MSEGSPLIPEQRRKEILRLVRTEGVVSYRRLTELLGVSQMTVRRDVAVLAEQGRARSTQGGVAAEPREREEPQRAEKARSDVEQKHEIARRAAGLVEDGMSVYLDAGTTVQGLRGELEERRGLTIVTNDLSTAAAFLDHPDAELIMIGGRIDKDNQSSVGRLAEMALDQLTVDIALLSCSVWDVAHGLTTPVEAKVGPKRAALASSTRSVLLADSSKYGLFAQYKVMRLTELDAVITDDRLPQEERRALRQSGVVLDLAGD
ncbi:DeoR/GlpR family DNA-binding transcription regulator [Brachybacterium kimchii]|uniref:DeoR/GlpR family DNA-binding transcription regulator n=1 Tax=Brachybacterium kimchii TaxID=2942909 RepID=A0ABY4N2V0_9MICO|nr:DeoR/GlpR family DNA-binding transcription regulator [Brachybacterium kimchii]UQN28890.1 DeoR/GlpR family DNA-binding transcription regulator [Brachybacterium kimchii]